ncbi:CBS domain-containing protein [Mycoplasmopsis cynos]|nr:CBS domain-containing protein [Mycoplasmopsis cynos]
MKVFWAQKALDLDSTKVSSHYIKLKDVTSIKFKANIQEALDIFKETNYSRLPIEKDGQLIGILLLKDIFILKEVKSLIIWSWFRLFQLIQFYLVP